MTTVQSAESAWAMCSSMFALFLSAVCLLAALMVMKMTFNLVSNWLKPKKGDSNEQK